jgi:hypothetical protein
MFCRFLEALDPVVSHQKVWTEVASERPARKRCGAPTFAIMRQVRGSREHAFERYSARSRAARALARRRRPWVIHQRNGPLGCGAGSRGVARLGRPVGSALPGRRAVYPLARTPGRHILREPDKRQRARWPFHSEVFRRRGVSRQEIHVAADHRPRPGEPGAARPASGAARESELSSDGCRSRRLARRRAHRWRPRLRSQTTALVRFNPLQTKRRRPC